MSVIVSVIMPTFNGGKFINDAIESVMLQSYSDLELIVIDDGSTDNTKSILTPYIESGKIIYLYQTNAGPAAARNTGIRAANGEFIAFLDSDDVWHNTFIEKLYNIISHSDCGLVYCGTEFVDEQLNSITNYCRAVNFHKGDVLLQLFCEHFILTPTVMIDKNCFDEAGLFNENLRVGEDYELLLRIVNKYKVDYTEEKLFYRRVLPNSLSRLDFKKDAINDLSTLESFLVSNPDFYNNNKKVINNRLAQYYFNLAYGCLEIGENIFPLKCLLKSLSYRFTRQTLINILYCVIPFGLRKALKAYA